MRARVLVLGGGVMGVRIAWACARRIGSEGGGVVLLEKRALAAGSSGRSGAVLRQHYANPEVAAMARDSLAEYSALRERTGRTIGFQPCGVLTLAGPRAPQWIRRLVANVAMLQGLGVDTRLCDAREVRALVPGIEVDDGAVGAFEPGAGFCDPVLAVEAFAELARASGTRLRIGLAGERLIVESGRVRGVETREGRIDAESVVLAAGPWTEGLLRSIGCSLPLEVVRPRQHFLDQLPPAPLRESLLARTEDEAPAAHPVLLDLELGYYTRCEPSRARTRIGALDHAGDARVAEPDVLDERVEPEFPRWARAQLETRLPAYRSRADQAPQAALYTLTPDSQPILGRLEGIEGLVVAAGFSGHGFKLAPSVGEGLAQLVLGEPLTAFDQAFFSAERFHDGRTPAAGAFGL